jgi:hypothetical protein
MRPAEVAMIKTGPHRGTTMIRRILNDVLLFSCVAAFVAGTVIVAATLLYAG